MILHKPSVRWQCEHPHEKDGNLYKLWTLSNKLNSTVTKKAWVWNRSHLFPFLGCNFEIAYFRYGDLQLIFQYADPQIILPYAAGLRIMSTWFNFEFQKLWKLCRALRQCCSHMWQFHWKYLERKSKVTHAEHFHSMWCWWFWYSGFAKCLLFFLKFCKLKKQIYLIRLFPWTFF